MIFDGDLAILRHYLRYLANEVGLRDWNINVPQEVPEGEDVQADALVTYGRKFVIIRFKADWPELEETMLRWVCVHELLHAHVNEIWNPLDNIADMIGKMLYEPTHEAMRLHIEHAVDAIADEWSRHLSLPSAWLEAATDPEVA